jgi:hypothetical protein
MDATDLQLRWRTLERPVGERLSAERVRDWVGGPVLLAVDASGVRHLLVRVGDTAHVQAPRPVSGLVVAVRRLHPSGEESDVTWLDLSSPDPQGMRPFAGLCADVLDDLPSTGNADPEVVMAVVARWRRFWSISRDGLSRDEQMGLFGELWLLLEWLRPLTLGAITAWRGPLGGRHDFVTARTSIEVKTTGSSTGPVVHRVHGLDQLAEPGKGVLYLLSLRAVADPLGEHTLDGLIHQAQTIARGIAPAAAGALDDRLTAAGWAAQDTGRYAERVRVTTQELFLVDETFPRLTSLDFPSGLPAGVGDVSYALDISACRRWRVAVQPDGDGPLARLGSASPD